MRFLAAVTLAVLVGCGTGSSSTAAPPAALRSLLDDAAPFSSLARGTDPWEVWVCAVPEDSVADAFDGEVPRLPLTPQWLADELDEHVGQYFDGLSHGAYRPRFTAGGLIELTSTDGPQQCVETAVERSSGTARGVMAVADAVHRSDADGGFGTPGAPCPDSSCPASVTGRAAYVGAADFHPDWGGVPAVDLAEHELGHALGWPHSGTSSGASHGLDYTSALDVMSNSAAPRDTDPERRHAPGTLAINRLAVGWLPLDDVAVVPAGGDTVELAPSASESGTRLAVVPLDDHRLLSVELLTAGGYDDHLPADGIAVHLVDISGPACGRPADQRCGPLERWQLPMVGEPPFTDLLRAGESWTGHGWTVRVLDDADTWRVAVAPAT